MLPIHADNLSERTHSAIQTHTAMNTAPIQPYTVILLEWWYGQSS